MWVSVGRVDHNRCKQAAVSRCLLTCAAPTLAPHSSAHSLALASWPGSEGRMPAQEGAAGCLAENMFGHSGALHLPTHPPSTHLLIHPPTLTPTLTSTLLLTCGRAILGQNILSHDGALRNLQLPINQHRHLLCGWADG